VKLGDMNVAKVAKDDLAQTQIGTPYYLAPEIWKNEVYSYKADVFSMGCVLYEMTALHVPFEAGSLQELFKQVTRGFISKIPEEYSADLYNVIKLCLTVDPKTRPNVAEMLENPLVKKRLTELGLLLGD
jgi:NIMA (never in mitosis gene a)-related kinase